jgi:hypothetical protein
MKLLTTRLHASPWPGPARRQLGVHVLEPEAAEVVGQLRVRRGADEERMPGREHLVDEPGLGDLRGPDRAAEPVLALEHEHPLAALREQRRAGERVDPAADEDGIPSVAHSTASPREWNVRLK